MAKEWPKAHGVLAKIQLKLEIMKRWGPASPVLCFFSQQHISADTGKAKWRRDMGSWERTQKEVQHHGLSPEWVRDKDVHCIHCDSESRLKWGSELYPQGSPSCS